MSSHVQDSNGDLEDNICKGVIQMKHFEQNVPKEWWKKLFNALYLKTDADVVEDDDITALEVQMFIELLNLKPHESILDLCCGQGRHSLGLASVGYTNIQGVDQSAFLIDVAKKRVVERGLKVSFCVGDARHVPLESNQFNVILCAGNSFGYSANTACDQLILSEVQRMLVPGGRLFLDLTDGSHVRTSYVPRSWEWVDNSLFVCRERTLSGDGNMLISREIITDPAKGVIADQFYSEKLFDPASITKLLEDAGFVSVVVHGSYHADSKRGQDLGMMECRLLVTAFTASDDTVVDVPIENSFVAVREHCAAMAASSDITNKFQATNL